MQNHKSSEGSRISQSLEIAASVSRKQQRSIGMDEDLQQKKIRQPNPVKQKDEDDLPTKFEPGGASSSLQIIAFREFSDRRNGDSSNFVRSRDREKSGQKKLRNLDHSTIGPSSSKVLDSGSTCCNDDSKIEHIHGEPVAIEQKGGNTSASMSGSFVSQTQVGTIIRRTSAFFVFKSSYGMFSRFNRDKSLQEAQSADIYSNVDPSTSLKASLSDSLKAINTNANVAERTQHQQHATLLQPLTPILSLQFQLSQISQSGAQCMMPPNYPECNAINRGPLLHFPTDNEFLSEKQIFIRKQIEFFEAGLGEVGKTTSGRKRPIIREQVGIQCRHCAVIPMRYRERGAVYFPSKLIGVYQAAQNMVSTHMITLCRHIDRESKETLISFMQTRSCTGHGGKVYWAETAKAQNVLELETEGGLRFETRCSRYPSLTSNSHLNNEDEK
jgi:hypothetical protein